ncbi:MAG: ATP-binding protein [Terriglobia bacterium]|jgi:PAS domain S-box-containing protein
MRSPREVLLSVFHATKSSTQRVMGHRGIRDREAWAYILVLALAVVTVGVFLRFQIASLYQEQMANWRRWQSSVADDRALMVSDWLKEHQANAQLFATRPAIRAALRIPHDLDRLSTQSPASADLKTRLDVTARLYGYVGVYLLDRDARVVGQSSRSVPVSPRLVEISRIVARTGTLRIDLVGDAPAKTLISFSAPVLPGSGTAEGVRSTGQLLGVGLLLVDAPQTLFPILTREGVPTRTGETLLVRREGDDMVFFSPLRHVPADSPNLRFPLPTAPLPARIALEGRDTFVEYHDYRGVPVLAATRHITLTGWGMVRKVDRAEALEGFRRMALVEGLAAGLLIILLGSLLVFHRRHVLTRALKQQEEKFRALLESAPDAMVIADRKGRIVLVNAHTEKIFSFERKELVGQALGMLFPEWAGVQPGESGPWDFLVAQHGGKTLEMRGLRRDGTQFPAEVRLSPIQTVEGVLVSCGIRDITERKQAQEALARRSEELERSNADLEQFAFVASHDLKEPLRTVASFVQLLQRRYEGKLDAQADEFIAFAIDGASRMQKLIDDLLAFSRVGTRGGEFQSVECERALHAALQNLTVAIQESGAGVTAEALPTVHADVTQLVSLFQNLIGNALKFHGAEPPRIHVSAQRNGTYWQLSVRDNGIGIEPRYFDRVFGIFQRLHTRQEYPGTGIGLAICKKIVARHGGKIWLESEPGKGTTFYFTLPVRHHAGDHRPKTHSGG